MKPLKCVLSVCLLMAEAVQADVLYQDHFNNDSLAVNTNGIGGGAVNNTIEAHSWLDDGEAAFVTSGTTFTRRALLYSENAFQSDEGFKLTVYYTTGSIGDVAAHNFSFGLVSSGTDLSSYTNYNPFAVTTDVYSLGVNLTADNGVGARGLNFTDGSSRTTLDQAGDNVQFVPGSSSWVELDIGPDGAWQYSINGVTEASGVIAGGFDLSKSYHVAVYGQDDTSKSVQSLKLETYNPLPGLGERADWLRGAWGALWLPEKTYNGKIEGVTIDEFVTQIEDLKTIDYVQIGLASPNIFSPVHMAPHDLIESFWQGDTDANGNPINLVVPRASAPDPFLSYLNALNAAGLKVQVYVNSYNLLARNPDGIPDGYPDVSARWMAWCDTNETAQAFINSQLYHTNGTTNRPYMFCYAEFVLKEYAERYGNLIDAWYFDSADNIMESGCGDDPHTGILDDQRIYEAFATACRAGNPKVAVAFNNSVGTAAEPFATPTLFDDYTFGHPFGGAGDMVETESLYNRNYGICEYMSEHDSLPFATTDSRTWNDKVVGHFFPKQSTTSWNAGAVPCLSNDQFVAWTDTGIVNGGAVTWGTALWYVNLENPGYNLTLRDYALEQLELTDAHLSTNQFPAVPNWRRSDTPLSTAIIGQSFSHTLTDGFDFWDPSAGSITDLFLIDSPLWLTVTNSGPGEWMLSGVPTESEATDYTFQLRAMMGTTGTSRTVELVVFNPTSVPMNVEIQATVNTNYGTDAIATMLSAVQTNALATFQIAFDVDPMEGTSITSDGGLWGINAGEGASGWWNTFDGSLTQSVDSVSNIRVVNFNANGGMLTLDDFADFSFEFVTVHNGANVADRIKVVAGGVANAAGGLKMAASPAIIDLQALVGSASVSSFTLENGNLGNAKDRWNIGSVQVGYSIQMPPSVSYTTWVSGYGLMDDDALPGADVENGGLGDGYDNLAEFALGMNPTNADAGSKDWIDVTSEGGTNFFEYIINRRSDYVPQGLAYLLIESTNLEDSVASTNAQDQVFVGAAVEGYQPVTNRYMTDKSVKFIELKITYD